MTTNQKLAHLIRGYHSTSHSLWASLPIFVSSGCRFEPTCSEYCALALEKHGVVRGLWKGLIRIMRCNPLTRPGVDLP